MVRYSPRAAKALALLKRPYNDVDIFVEDTGNHNMWLLTVRRLLPLGTKITSVNMLGGRDAVISACKLDQTNTGRRKLYIVDGDFDYLLGKSRKKLKYYYRLRSYCIENLLIRENPLIQVGLENSPKLNEAQIAKEINFQIIMREVEELLVPLFISYAVAHKLHRPAKTVSFPVGSLFQASSNGPRLDRLKVLNRIIGLYRTVAKQKGANATRATQREISLRVSKLTVCQIVSGKDYILPLPMARFKASCGYGRSMENFKVALARSYDETADPYFARRLRNLSS